MKRVELIDLRRFTESEMQMHSRMTTFAATKAKIRMEPFNMSVI